MATPFLQSAAEIGIGIRGWAEVSHTTASEPWTEAEHMRLLEYILEDALQIALFQLATTIRRNLHLLRLLAVDEESTDLVSEALGLPTDLAFGRAETVQEIVPILVNSHGINSGTVELGYEQALFTVTWNDAQIILSISEVEFELGSLKEKMQALLSSDIWLPVLLFLATPPAAHAYDQHLQNVRIERTIEGSTCKAEVSFDMDHNELQDLSREDIRWSDPLIDERERQLRICRVQFILIADNAAPGRLDGIMGPRTEGALRRFAERKNLKGVALDSDELLESLARAATQTRL